MSGFIVMGQGNPGSEHAAQRHNAGFWAINRLAKRYNVSMHNSSLASTGKDRLVIIWDAAPDASTEPLTLFAGHNGGVNAAIWSPDDSLVASAADDGTIIIWSVVDSVNGE